MTRRENGSAWLLWPLALLLAYGLLTLWVQQRWAVACFQLGICALACAWAIGAVWRRVAVRWHPALAPFALIPLWALLQLATGRSQQPWATSEKAIEYGVHWLAIFLLLQFAWEERARRRLLNALLIFTTLLAVLALLQRITGSPRVFWLFDSGVDGDILGPFVYHNKYAQFIEIVFPLAVLRAVEERRYRPVYLVAAALMAAGVIAGATRSGFVFILAEVLLVLGLCWRRHRISGRATALLAAQTAAVIAVWGTLAGWSELWTRLMGLDPLADLRWAINRSSLAMTAAHPWLGVGLGAWPVVYPEYATFDIGLFVNQAHCDWLQWLCEGGWPLLLILLAFFAALLVPLVRSIWGVGFLVVLAHAAVDYPFQALPAFATFLFCAAYLAALDGEAGARNVRGHRIP
jgi:O-antigen ligase